MIEGDGKIEIEFLDHVAIRVADLEASAKQYQKVLGLKRYQLPEWGDFPIFLLSGKTGIALFPANTRDTKLEPTSRTWDSNPRPPLQKVSKKKNFKVWESNPRTSQ